MRDKSTDKKRERRFSLRNIISTLLLIFALGLLFYPIFVNYMVAQQNKTTIQKYTRNVETLKPAQAKHLKEEAALYNQYIYTKSQYQSWNKAVPEYKKQLITDKDKVIAYLSIPQIKITNIPVYSGDSEETLAAGVGHIPQTILPIGGENTHAVLSAHSGHINNTLFSDLEDLKMKDVFYIHVLDQTLKYEIFERKIVNPEDTDAINVIPGKDLVTLVTCWPTGINNKRLLVTGRRVATTTMTPQEHIQRNKYGYNFWVMLLASGLALCALGLVLRNILGAKKYNMRIDRAQFDAIQQGKQELIIASLPQGSKVPFKR
ncbi:class C sortase [Lactococcus garvieae]|uniref:class C sortase n=1 Tax=Lactococcus garvieae TaxID=1363 RepID=UPI0038518F76